MSQKINNNNSREKNRTFFNKRLFSNGSFKNSSFNNKKNIIKVTSIRDKIIDKETNNSLQQYSEFKRNLYIKERKEKENEKNDQFHNECIKELKRNFNYTNMVKLIDIALNKPNPFKDYDIKNKINKLEYVNKNNKKNKINNILAKEILHDKIIKSKVDSGIKKDHKFNKLYQKIKYLKNNIEKRNVFQRKKNVSNLNKYNEYTTIKDYRNINLKITKKNDTDIFRLTKDKKSYNKSACLEQTLNNKSEINSNNIANFKKRLISSKSLIEFNNSSFQMKDSYKDFFRNKIKTRKNKSFHLKNVKFNDKIFSKNNSVSESMNFISSAKHISQFQINKYKKINSAKSKIVKYKSNNYNHELNDRTISNIKSQKICNSLIENIYRDFKRIKLNSIKLKNKYKEWGFSSLKKIDSMVNAKEEMLIFLLKQKYLKIMKVWMKDKKIKRTNKSFKKKLKDSFKFFDDDDDLGIRK